VTGSFAYLGLRADADERAVKRAYAQRLKQIRPEDDPKGFQVLHNHYRLALKHARQRAETAQPGARSAQTAAAAQESEQRETIAPDIAQAEATIALPPAAPTPPPIAAKPALFAARPVFDSAAFLQALLVRIGDDDAGKLRDWLQSIDAFWSLAIKNHAGHVVLQKLTQDRPPMRSEVFDAILAFFNFDNALNDCDHVAIAHLRETLQLQYELSDAHRDQFAEHMQRTTKFNSSQIRRMIAILLRPYVLWRNYASALFPGRPTLMTNFIQALSHGQTDLLCPPVDPRHLKFWFAVADRGHFTRSRILLSYLRIAVLMLSATAVLCALALLTPFQRFEKTLVVLIFFARAFVISIALWTIWLVWRAMLRWQTGAEDGRLDRSGIGRLLFIPIVAAVAAAACVYAVREWQLNAGFIAAIVIAILAVLRFWRRAGLRFLGRVVTWITGIAYVNLIRVLYFHGRAVNALSDNDERIFIGVVLVAVAGLAWVTDLVWQRRRFYRPSAQGRR
jgi:hypothetical protein